MKNLKYFVVLILASAPFSIIFFCFGFTALGIIIGYFIEKNIAMTFFYMSTLIYIFLIFLAVKFVKKPTFDKEDFEKWINKIFK